ncbi:hypothetical protein FM107_01275 [Sphingobacterium sp. JB170]|nr:hypothetical protein FM107_01275 [Sphingobacterium sp. JB170]
MPVTVEGGGKFHGVDDGNLKHEKTFYGKLLRYKHAGGEIYVGYGRYISFLRILN